MNEKKAFVCTLLFITVLAVIIVWSCTIRGHDGTSLYQLLSSTGFGIWLSEIIVRFFNWLTKGDENK